MQRFFENKLAFAAILLLFALAMVCNATIGGSQSKANDWTVTAANQMNQLVKKGPNLPPDPWEWRASDFCSEGAQSFLPIRGNGTRRKRDPIFRPTRGNGVPAIPSTRDRTFLPIRGNGTRRKRDPIFRPTRGNGVPAIPSTRDRTFLPIRGNGTRRKRDPIFRPTVGMACQQFRPQRTESSPRSVGMEQGAEGTQSST